MRIDLLAEPSFMFTMFADDRCLKIKPATFQDRASLDEHVKTFFRNQPADTERAQTTVFRGRVRCVAEQVCEFSIEPVIDATNVRVRLDIEKMFAVRVRAGHDETRRAHLAS